MKEKNESLHDSFRRVSVLLRRRGRRAEGNLPSTQNRALSILNLNNGLSQRQLAYILGIRPQSSGEIVSKLEKNGWLERKADEKDSRVNRLYLTEAGKRQAEKLNDETYTSDIFDCLDEKEKESLGELLDKVITNTPESKIDVFDFKMPPRFHRPRMEVRNMPFEEDMESHHHNYGIFRKPRMEAKKIPFEKDDDEEDIRKSRII